MTTVIKFLEDELAHHHLGCNERGEEGVSPASQEWLRQNGLRIKADRFGSGNVLDRSGRVVANESIPADIRELIRFVGPNDLDE